MLLTKTVVYPVNGLRGGNGKRRASKMENRNKAKKTMKREERGHEWVGE
jgi:hypothetical protein